MLDIKRSVENSLGHQNTSIEVRCNEVHLDLPPGLKPPRLMPPGLMTRVARPRLSAQVLSTALAIVSDQLCCPAGDGTGHLSLCVPTDQRA